jgi:hypothetical protein
MNKHILLSSPVIPSHWVVSKEQDAQGTNTDQQAAANKRTASNEMTGWKK